MGNYLRNYVPGGTFFFTAVTYKRQKIFFTPLARRCLRQAFQIVRRTRKFEVFAIVLLPDHLHTVWILPDGDVDYSIRWRHLKATFTRIYLESGGYEGVRTKGQIRSQSRGIWQPRFWEHTVRDEEDLKRCVDYIHYNPVKHGLVDCVENYQWSSFHRFAKMGEYSWVYTDDNEDPNRME
ncbi:MAG: transposase [Phycisphaerae bacterium]|nr:transposase [Phycisphaerae bacterium]